MKLKISYSPDEEERVKRIEKIISTLFPTAHSSYVQKEKHKYKHCYIDTYRHLPRSDQ